MENEEEQLSNANVKEEDTEPVEDSQSGEAKPVEDVPLENSNPNQEVETGEDAQVKDDKPAEDVQVEEEKAAEDGQLEEVQPSVSNQPEEIESAENTEAKEANANQDLSEAKADEVPPSEELKPSESILPEETLTSTAEKSSDGPKGTETEEPSEQAQEEPSDQAQEEPPIEKDGQASESTKPETAPDDPGEKHVNIEMEESPATVKFQIIPSGEVITTASTLATTIAALKEMAAALLQLPTSEILIRRHGEELNFEHTLHDLGVSPNGSVQFEILAAKEDVSLKPVTPKNETEASDFITVRVQKDNSQVSDVVVKIERQYPKKAFLGGYRHKLSGSEYHHASAQTIQSPPKVSPTQKFSRDCQTVFERNRSQQTTNVTSTQMPKTGCYISTEQDKILIPRRYVSYDEYMKRRIQAVIVLQSYFRRWQARYLVNELRLDRDRRIEWERQEEIRKRKEKEDRIKREFEKRINPKTREDFDLLYAALEKWRLEELGHIDEAFTGPERKAALCALLEQETQLINSIDRRKIEAFKDGKEKRTMQFLDKAAAPKRWKAYDGRFTEMDTQYTIRAKELRDIYNSINMKYLTQDERLDVLLTLKHTVKEHDCKLTREITELIDREADLLMRGMRDANLEGLRKRISSLFLQYCKNPLFNPEAARLLKVPQDPSTLVKDIYFCPSSNQYLPSTEFKLTSKSRVVGKSRKALQLDNEARTRQDYSHYRVMLRALRRSEENYHDNSKIAYLIQEKDLQYLVENIWAAQSILSSWDDLYDLILVRWDKGEEWSPWNTILLTKDEAMAHSKLDHLQEAYSKQFISKVAHKHTLARVHFAKLPGMAEALRKKTTGSQRLPGVGTIEGVSAY